MPDLNLTINPTNYQAVSGKTWQVTGLRVDNNYSQKCLFTDSKSGLASQYYSSELGTQSTGVYSTSGQFDNPDLRVSWSLVHPRNDEILGEEALRDPFFKSYEINIRNIDGTFKTGINYINDGRITAVDLISGGSGYINPTVFISGDGTGAAIEVQTLGTGTYSSLSGFANIGFSGYATGIHSVNVVSGGSGYTAANTKLVISGEGNDAHTIGDMALPILGGDGVTTSGSGAYLAVASTGFGLRQGYHMHNYIDIPQDLNKEIFGGEGQRKFMVEVITNDFYDQTSTGRIIVDFPSPQFETANVLDTKRGLSFGITPSSGQVFENQIFEDISLEKIEIHRSASSDFSIKTGDVFTSTLFHTFRADSRQDRLSSLSELDIPLEAFQENDFFSGYYYKFLPYDKFGTGKVLEVGTGIRIERHTDPVDIPSGFRLITDDDKAVGTNIQGQVVTNTYLSWKKDVKFNTNQYEVTIEDQVEKDSHTIILNPPQISGIDFLISGTGVNRADFDEKSAAEIGTEGMPKESFDIFSPYSTNGIQWIAHTVFLDSEYLSTVSNSINNVEFVEVPAGNTNSGYLYFTGLEGKTINYAASNNFLLSTDNAEAHALVARNVNNEVVVEYEPRIKIPTTKDGSYNFKVRGVNSLGEKSNYSNIVNFTASGAPSHFTFDPLDTSLKIGGTGTITKSGPFVTTVGGSGITAVGTGVVVVGGINNRVTGELSALVGGSGNRILGAVGRPGEASFLGGGRENYISGNRNVLVGGDGNLVSGDGQALVGGLKNIIFGSSTDSSSGSLQIGNPENIEYENSIIGGGNFNVLSGDTSFIGGGYENTIGIDVARSTNIYGEDVNSQDWTKKAARSLNSSAIVGGRENQIFGSFNFIGGGRGNQIFEGGNQQQGAYSVIAGGQDNIITGTTTARSIILGGKDNINAGVNSIVGGIESTGQGNQSLALGSYGWAAHNGAFVLADSSRPDKVAGSYGHKKSLTANSLNLFFDNGTYVRNGDLYVSGDATISGDLKVSGSFTLGDATTDSLDSFGAISSTGSHISGLSGYFGKVGIGTTTLPELDGTRLMVANGNAGFGNTAVMTVTGPIHPIHVSDASDASILIDSYTDTVGTSAKLYFRTEADDSNVRVKGGIFFERLAGTYGNGIMRFAVDSIGDNNNVGIDDSKMVIDRYGNVLIGEGVGGQGAKLTVSGDASITGELRVAGDARVASDVHVGTDIIHDSDPDTYVRFNTDRIRLFAGGVELIDAREAGTDYVAIGGLSTVSSDVNFFVNSAGAGGTDYAFAVDAGDSSVGININPANAKGSALVVSGDASITGQLKVSGTSTAESGHLSVKGSGYFADGIVFGDGTTQTTASAGGGGGGAVTAVANGADNRVATFSSSTALNGEANLTFDGTRFTVDGDASITGQTRIAGDLGLNCNPSFRLHVADNDSDIAYFQSSQATTSNVYISNTNATTNNTANLYFGPANNVAGARIKAQAMEDFSVSANRTADLEFQTRNNGTFTENVLRLKADGKVGIGTNAPAGKLHIVSSDTNNNLILESTDAAATTAPDLVLYRTTTSAADNDYIGVIRFRGKNEILEDVEYGAITSQIKDTTDGSEDGELALWTMEGGTLTQQVTLNSVGNVGIGTNNPQELLHIDGASPRIRLRDDNAAGTPLAHIDASDGALKIQADSSNETAGSFLTLEVDGSEYLRATGGYIGIGTTTPAYLLELYGSPDAQLRLHGSNSWAGINFRDSNGNDHIWFNGSNETFTIGGGGANIANKKLHIDGATSIGSNYDSVGIPTNALIVEGNVGVGTAQPTGKLHIYQSGDSQPAFLVEGSQGSLFSVEDTLTGSLMSVNDIAGLPVFEAFDDGTIVMGQYNSGDLVVTGNKVGIGTSAPTSSIQVKGNQGTTFEFTDSSNRSLTDLGAGVLSWNAAAVLGSASWGGTADLEIDQVASSTRDILNVGDKFDVSPVKNQIRLRDHAYVSGNLYVSGSVVTADGTSPDHISGLSGYFGKVGIGTTSDMMPGTKLHVFNGAGAGVAGGNYNVNHDDVIIEGDGNVGINLFSPATNYQYLAFGDPFSANAGYVRYYHGDNSMVFRVNGADKVYFNSAGNVGIGAATPQAKLQVNGDASITGELKVNGEIVVADHLVHKGDTDTYLDFTLDRFRFFAGGVQLIDAREAGSDYVKIGDAGEDVNFFVISAAAGIDNVLEVDAGSSAVGINCDPLDAKGAALVVSGDASITGELRVGTNVQVGQTIALDADSVSFITGGNLAVGTTTSDNALSIVMPAADSSNLFDASISDTNAALSVFKAFNNGSDDSDVEIGKFGVARSTFGASTDWAGHLKFFTHGGITTPNFGSERFRLTWDGNGRGYFGVTSAKTVGIYAGDNKVQITSDGTQNVAPQATLVVSGDASITGGLRTNGAVGINGANPDSILQINNAGSSSYRFGYGGTSDVYLDADNIYFRSDGGGNPQTVIRGGNVGIGTTNPGEKLEIYGNGAALRFEAASTDQDPSAVIKFAENSSTDNHFRIEYDGSSAHDANGALIFGGYGATQTDEFAMINREGQMMVGNFHQGINGRPQATFTVSGDASITGELKVNGEVHIPNNLVHKGDTNTYLNFNADRIRLNAGGVELIDARQAGTDYVAIGGLGDNGDVNFIVNSAVNGIDHVLEVDAGTSTVGINCDPLDAKGAALVVSGDASVTGELKVDGAIHSNNNVFANNYFANDYVYHNSDVDCYFGFLSNDHIVFRTAGTDRVLIDDAGHTSITGDLRVAQYIKHGGDEHTYIDFTSDGIGLFAAGKNLFQIDEDNGKIVVNDSGGDYNFQVESEGNENMIFVDAGNDLVGFGTSSPSPSYTVTVSGGLAADYKSFIIDHPDPAKPDKQLAYASSETPEHNVFVRGKAQSKIIELPDHWPYLVHEDSISVQLTPIGEHQELYVESIKDNKILINNNKENKINCFYLVHAERKDIGKLEIEPDKSVNKDGENGE